MASRNFKLRLTKDWQFVSGITMAANYARLTVFGSVEVQTLYKYCKPSGIRTFEPELFWDMFENKEV